MIFTSIADHIVVFLADMFKALNALIQLNECESFVFTEWVRFTLFHSFKWQIKQNIFKYLEAKLHLIVFNLWFTWFSFVLCVCVCVLEHTNLSCACLQTIRLSQKEHSTASREIHCCFSGDSFTFSLCRSLQHFFCIFFYRICYKISTWINCFLMLYNPLWFVL